METPITQSATNVDTSTAETADVSNAETVDATVKTPEQKEVERKFKLKYGKTDKEVTEKELIAMAQKAWASDEKFQGASKKEKQLQALIEKFEEDPDAFIRHIGKDPTEIYKKQLAKELQRRVMTPEQRELADAKAKLMEYEKEKKDRETAEHEEQISRLQKHYEQQYDKEMSEAIMSSGLPKTPKTVKRAAQLAYKNLEMGLDLPWPTIMEMVKEEYKSDMKELFGQSDGDKLLELFGPDLAKKLSNSSLKKRVIDPEPVNDQTRQISKDKPAQTKEKYANDDDWEEKMRKFKNS